jgi:hypothetical protein
MQAWQPRARRASSKHSIPIKHCLPTVPIVTMCIQKARRGISRRETWWAGCWSRFHSRNRDRQGIMRDHSRRCVWAQQPRVFSIWSREVVWWLNPALLDDIGMTAGDWYDTAFSYERSSGDDHFALEKPMREGRWGWNHVHSHLVTSQNWLWSTWEVQISSCAPAPLFNIDSTFSTPLGWPHRKDILSHFQGFIWNRWARRSWKTGAAQ